MSTDKQTEEQAETQQSPQELGDEELKEVTGGVGGNRFDSWHQLPDGSGSGYGE